MCRWSLSSLVLLKIESEKMQNPIQQKGQELLIPILNQVDNAVALFDQSGQLVLFNEKFPLLWGLERDWLEELPPFPEIVAVVVARGYWSHHQAESLEVAFAQTAIGSPRLCVEQTDGISLQVDITPTSDGGRLLIFRDITEHQRSQENLEGELRRLRFLLGLTELLQASGDLLSIGQFALTYLVQAMNSAFGDVKVIEGEGSDRHAGALTNQISSTFIATYGKPAVGELEALLHQGIPYGQGLLWEVVETGEPLFVEDYHKHPKAVPGFRHPGIGQLGIFPIPATTGRILGVLTLESRSLQKLQEAPQQDMLLAACRMLGAAIERAQAQENLRKTNQDLERASQLKSEFLASMSHELRTPLNGILGFADLLQRQIAGQLNRRQINQVKAIEKSGQHLLELINDILDLSKIEAGKAELQLESISIQDLCSSCLKMIQPRAAQKKLALSLELDYRLNRASLDERRVRQMLVNLLSNAVKFTPEGGKVKLSGKLGFGLDMEGDFRPDCSPVSPTSPYLCLEVQDSGIGIPEDKWHLLFRPFQQVDSSLSRRHEGTGLGLALTKRLAELHGGTISFQSGLGLGSVFRIWLPLTDTLMDEELLVDEAPLRNRGDLGDGEEMPRDSADQREFAGRILVVEDQPSNQVLVTELLESSGYEVELICDGQTMMAAISSPLVTGKNLPDLVLMDIQLPGVDGLELIRQMKAHPLWRVVPVVAVTAMAMPGDRELCLGAGAIAYLSKPLNLDQLLTLVESLLISNSTVNQEPL